MTGELLQARAATNQSRREINERIEAHNASYHWVDPPFADWICECAVEDCVLPVQLTVAEYESVRANPAHFLVAPGDEHVVSDVERVVERNERFWIVEKVGLAGDVSETLDDRGRDAASELRERELDADEIAWNLPVRSR